MRVGIDSYCYHRYFGEVYPQQKAPPQRWTLERFIDRAHELKVDGVSLESCFVEKRGDAGYLRSIKERLDGYKLDRVWAWGHPDGLEGGKNKTAFDDMLGSLKHAQRVGAGVMRVVGSSLAFRFENHQDQIKRLVGMFKEAVKPAADHNVRLAVENHIDFTAQEILQLLQEVGSPYLGLNFDTGNFARLLDDPVKGMEKLAPQVLATHIKDLKINPRAAADDWYFFSTTPVGDGFIDNLKLARLLKQANFQGFLAVELDFLHPDYSDEDQAVAQSIKTLKKIAAEA